MTYFSLHISRICKDLQEIKKDTKYNTKSPLLITKNAPYFDKLFEELIILLE